MTEGSSIVTNDKEHIRLRFEKLIADGASADALKSERTSLSHELSVNLQSLRSVSAYPRYCATQAIARSGLRIDRDELLQIAHNLRDISPEEMLSDLSTYAGVLDIETTSLGRAINIYYNLMEDKPVGSVASTAQQDHPNSTCLTPDPGEPYAAMNPEADLIIAANEATPGKLVTVSGDLLDYDFEAKRQWRRSWAEFISDHSTYRERENGRVLCMPGQVCKNEVQHYLELGYKPENIFAVERSSAVWDEFKRNAEALGINPIKGDIGRVAKSFDKPFDVVNLDWLGGLCERYLFALQQVPIGEKCILITNTQGAREGSSIQLRLFEDVVRQNPGIFGDTGNVVAGQGLLQSAQQSLLNKRTFTLEMFYSSDRPEIKELRAKALDQGLLNSVGLRRSPYYDTFVSKLTSVVTNPFAKLKRTVFSDLEVFSDFQTQIVVSFIESLARTGYFTFGENSLLPSMFYWPAMVGDCVTARPVVTALKRVSYVSEADSHKTYFSRFAVIGNNARKYRDWKGVVDPLIEVYKLMMPEIEKQTEKVRHNEPAKIAFPIAISPLGPKLKTRRAESGFDVIFKQLQIRAYDKRFIVDIGKLRAALHDFKRLHYLTQDLINNPPPIETVG